MTVHFHFFHFKIHPTFHQLSADGLGLKDLNLEARLHRPCDPEGHHGIGSIYGISMVYSWYVCPTFTYIYHKNSSKCRDMVYICGLGFSFLIYTWSVSRL